MDCLSSDLPQDLCLLGQDAFPADQPTQAGKGHPGKEECPRYLTSLDQSALDLTCALVRYPSVTPWDGGCLHHLKNLLDTKGFVSELVQFNQTRNLYARLGTKGPFLLFVGHVDVVPPGDLSQWRFDPFSPTVDGGILYGRGVADMKGAIACFLRALFDLLAHQDLNALGFSVGLLLTSDEEGPGHDGVQRMVGWLRDKKIAIDHILIGEPTGDAVGSVLQIGRRGSVTAHITDTGVQSHIAYIDPQENPAVRLTRCLHALGEHTFDAPGSSPFPATKVQITSLSSDNIAVNVTPSKASASVGIRYGTQTSGPAIQKTLEHICQTHLGPQHRAEISQNGAPFLTQDRAWIDCAVAAITEVMGTHSTPLTTQGGTTDGRFLSSFAPIVEIGLPQTTIHQINEHVAVQDLETLKEIYWSLLKHYSRSYADVFPDQESSQGA